MIPPVVSGAQGDDGRMDDETLTKVERLVAGMAMRLDDQQGWDSARIALNHIRRELGDTRARLAAVEALTEKWRYKGEFGWGAWQEGYGPDEEGHVLDAASAELRAALGATDQAGGGG